MKATQLCGLERYYSDSEYKFIFLVQNCGDEPIKLGYLEVKFWKRDGTVSTTRGSFLDIDPGEKTKCFAGCVGEFDRAVIKSVTLDGQEKAVNVEILRLKKKLGGFFSSPEIVWELSSNPQPL